MQSPIDIQSAYLEIVRQILALHVPGRDVWAFGSRVRGNARSTSDLDLVVMGDEPLSLRAMAMLRNAFSESDLPMKIDVLDWASTSLPFRKIIENQKMLIRQGSEEAAMDA